MKSLTEQGIWVKRTVTVLARLTPTLRQTLGKQLRADLGRLDPELAQLRQRVEKLDEANGQDARDLVRRLRTELERGEAQRQDLLQRLKRLAELPEGTEIERGKLDSFVKLEVGARLDEFTGTVLVIEDGVVVDIRQRAAVEGSGGFDAELE